MHTWTCTHARCTHMSMWLPQRYPNAHGAAHRRSTSGTDPQGPDYGAAAWHGPARTRTDPKFSHIHTSLVALVHMLLAGHFLLALRKHERLLGPQPARIGECSLRYGREVSDSHLLLLMLPDGVVWEELAARGLPDAAKAELGARITHKVQSELSSTCLRFLDRHAPLAPLVLLPSSGALGHHRFPAKIPSVSDRAFERRDKVSHFSVSRALIMMHVERAE
mmetsp:Transcript_19384/g.39625  ORF Transcript_19384/g.39625 Transcript_19384/m.39625 type:complete len:221 (-) Transcript_19384:833-1495(-)